MEKKKILEYLLKKYPSLDSSYIESIVDKFFQIIALKLKDENRIELRNFGVFKLKKLDERKIFNPHKQQLELVPGKSIPSFKCSKALHKISA